MNTTHKQNLLAVALTCALAATSARAQTVKTRIGDLDFEHGVPTKETVTNLYAEMDFQRACQLYLWALPIVGVGNLEVILKGTTGALPGDLTVYVGNEQKVFLTPNWTTPTGTVSIARGGRTLSRLTGKRRSASPRT